MTSAQAITLQRDSPIPGWASSHARVSGSEHHEEEPRRQLGEGAASHFPHGHTELMTRHTYRYAMAEPIAQKRDRRPLTQVVASYRSSDEVWRHRE
jgi:hypothetical protein